MQHNNQSIDLYVEKEADGFPVIFINENYIYSGEMDKNNFEFLDMYMITLYTLDDYDMKKNI